MKDKIIMEVLEHINRLFPLSKEPIAITSAIEFALMIQSKQIFDEIDKLIIETKSEIPVPIERSKFIEELKKLREKYENS